MMVPLMPDTVSRGASGAFPSNRRVGGAQLPVGGMVGLAGSPGNAQMVPGGGGLTAIGPDCYVDQGKCVTFVKHVY